MMFRSGTSCIALLLGCSMAAIGTAQERQGGVQLKAGQGQIRVDVDTPRTTENTRAEQREMAHRASTIRGMTVKNEAGKELGSVSDIVIDVRAGQVKYAALSYGGFLGVGDKLFAVPWASFDHRHDAGSDKHFLVLNVDEQTLKSAPGFDQSNWPNFADRQFVEGIDKYYAPRQDANRGADVRVDVGRVDVNVDVTRDQNRAAVPSKDVMHRSSEIVGMNVTDAAGKSIGSINDLVVGMDSGKVRYAALSMGGFLGIGDKLLAVPWHALDCQYDADEKEYQLVLAVDEATLKKAPGFDQNNWPNLADPRFGDEFDKYYENTRRAPQTTAPRTN
jgi:sporulation protein YlmC with PRC-barrel domain